MGSFTTQLSTQHENSSRFLRILRDFLLCRGEFLQVPLSQPPSRDTKKIKYLWDDRMLILINNWIYQVNFCGENAHGEWLPAIGEHWIPSSSLSWKFTKRISFPFFSFISPPPLGLSSLMLSLSFHSYIGVSTAASENQPFGRIIAVQSNPLPQQFDRPKTSKHPPQLYYEIIDLPMAEGCAVSES